MLHRVTCLPGALCLLARSTLLGGLSFCRINVSSRVTRLAEVQGPRYIPRKLLMLTASGDYAQLVECKITALDTEKRPLAERVIKKLNFPPKRFFCPPFCLLCGCSSEYLAQVSCFRLYIYFSFLLRKFNVLLRKYPFQQLSM